jgi:hypothetical protein
MNLSGGVFSLSPLAKTKTSAHLLFQFEVSEWCEVALSDVTWNTATRGSCVLYTYCKSVHNYHNTTTKISCNNLKFKWRRFFTLLLVQAILYVPFVPCIQLPMWNAVVSSGQRTVCLFVCFVVYLTTLFQHLRLYSVDFYSVLIRLPSSSEAGETRVRNMADEFCRRTPIVLVGFFNMP